MSGTPWWYQPTSWYVVVGIAIALVIPGGIAMAVKRFLAQRRRERVRAVRRVRVVPTAIAVEAFRKFSKTEQGQKRLQEMTEELIKVARATPDDSKHPKYEGVEPITINLTAQANWKTERQALAVERHSVSSLLMAEKAEKAVLIAPLVVFALLVGLIMHMWEGFVIFLLFAGAYALDYALLTYRAEKGYFGNNEAEARELIRFILDNTDTFDGGGDHRVFDTTRSEAELAAEVYGYGHG